MKAYIGTKVVQAEPELAKKGGSNHKQGDAGYKVVYEDGYLSWSPKDVFERCYREVTEDEYVLISTGD